MPKNKIDNELKNLLNFYKLIFIEGGYEKKYQK